LANKCSKLLFGQKKSTSSSGFSNHAFSNTFPGSSDRKFWVLARARNSICLNEWLTEWTNERRNKWVNEPMKARINQSNDEAVKELTTGYINQWIDEPRH
jgi:hypothetical protein